MTVIILVGPPGSGKGTQAENLIDNFDFHKISSGDLLREEINSGSSKGKTIAAYVNEGSLVPDNLICETVLNCISKYKNKKILLDGFPRTKSQAVLLLSGMEGINLKIDAIIEFKIEDKVLIERIKNRYLCKNCKASFSRVIGIDPGKSDFVCPRCMSKEFEFRADDNEQTALKRIYSYKEETLQMMDFYRTVQQIKIIDIDANLKVQDINNKIQIILSSL